MSNLRHGRFFVALIITLIGLGAWTAVQANSGESTGSTPTALIFLWLAIILIGSKIGSVVEKFGQSGVLGELLYGILLGNLVLVGMGWLEPIRTNEIIGFLAQLGIVVLLFQIGLESNITEMKKLGGRALLVALTGVVVTFVLGAFVAGPLLLPTASLTIYLFLGATLTATSVSISARVFKDLGRLGTKEANLVLSAAVIDDILGLIILAIATATLTSGSFDPATISLISAKAIAFLIGSIVIGQLLAPYLGRAFAKIHTGVGMKFTIAICFGLVMAYLAHQIGLAPLIGAFAAGLILDPVHFHYFKDHHIVASLKEAMKSFDEKTKDHLDRIITPYADRHISDLIEPLVYFLVPVFFVMTGFAVHLTDFFNPQTIMMALVLTIVAIVGKLAAGLVAGSANKFVVGVGMVPRGEVELIFAVTGKALGLFSDQLFSAIVLMVIFTAVIVPPTLSYLIKRSAPSSSKLTPLPQ
ncbi:MAG: cation:proton antiporter [Candidatus Buchananbacteria bacterium]|nr:cation:proton antiporter [Candidatus Buchananbacteria bacterium]